MSGAAASERKSVADLPAEALAVLREQGVGGLLVAWMSPAAALAVLFVGWFVVLEVSLVVRWHGLYLRDAYDVTAWDLISTFLLIAVLASGLALAPVGCLVLATGRKERGWRGLLRLFLLTLPTAATLVIVFDSFFGGHVIPSLRQGSLPRVVAALAWLVGSSLFFPLAPAVIFVEAPSSLRAALRRARELVRGRVGLALAVKLPPVIIALGAAFQIGVGSGLAREMTGSPVLGDLGVFVGIIAMGFAPWLAGILWLAGYRVAVAGERAA